ncbi:MAG: anthranilate synthase component II [Bacteroidales bacterium]
MLTLSPQHYEKISLSVDVILLSFYKKESQCIPTQVIYLIIRYECMRTLLVDNHDSFTYNLYHLVKEANEGQGIVHVRNTECLQNSMLLDYDYIIISPGGGLPKEHKNLMNIVATTCQSHPVLGICLGHQALIETFGGKIHKITKPFHGIADEIKVIESSKLFKGLPRYFKGARYHSWVANKSENISCWNVTAVGSDNEIMAIEHKEKPLFGIQFHPESFVSEYGKQIIKNFYSYANL